MTTTQMENPIRQKPLRLWPGVVAACLLLGARFGVKALVPGFSGFSKGMLWALGAALVVLLWWVLFSRVPWKERLGTFALLVAGLVGAWFLKHESMGPLWLLAYAFPGVCVALVVGAAIGYRKTEGSRRLTMAAAILMACGVWLVARMGGISGDHDAEFGWRWVKSPEERLLAAAPLIQKVPVPVVAEAPKEQPGPTTVATPTESPAPEASKETAAPALKTHAIAERDWPGFRGPQRDGTVHGVQIATNWASTPPVEVWRKPVGPGWSSFAVRGDLIYTQEQRGDDEVVACYNAATGGPVWLHKDPVRFFESNAGAGPRGTPTLSNGRVYTMGATGLLNVLESGSGAVVWSRQAAADTGNGGVKAALPDWGFSSSPLVVDDAVIVAVAGRLVAYEAGTGKVRWVGPDGRGSYSSPHLVTLDGVQQVVLLSDTGAISVTPADGKKLWEHNWAGFPIVQPAVTADGDLLIAIGGEAGTRRLKATHAAEGWTVAERWTSKGLKPYFNDFVVHGGYVFGFDGRILSCLDLKDGARKWKGGRYGNGQLLLVADQGVLLVLSEEGELALVQASPGEFSELAKFPAMKGKTWNHPVLAGDLLLVRNGEEMVAFRMPNAAR